MTALDPVVKTRDGRDEARGLPPQDAPPKSALTEGKDGSTRGITSATGEQDEASGAPLREAIPPTSTNPLFPPLPLYGPPSMLRTLYCLFFRATSGVLSLYFLLTIVCGAVLDAVPRVARTCTQRATLQDPNKQRPFYAEEQKRQKERALAEEAWLVKSEGRQTPPGEKGILQDEDIEILPTEGGPDPLKVDIAYYARRVGLDAETYKV